MAIKFLKNRQRGFVILFAILVSTIILIITAGIFEFAFKGSILSSYARESQTAFYAADTGLECALYWDISPDIAETAFDQSSSTTATANCSGQDPLGIDSDSGDIYWFTLELDPALGDEAESGCAFVLIDKNAFTTEIDGQTVVWTEVTSAGYNSCSTVADVTSPDKTDINLIERRLSVQYPFLVQ